MAAREGLDVLLSRTQEIKKVAASFCAFRLEVFFPSTPIDGSTMGFTRMQNPE
jgi:hypothetical protein